MVQTLKDEKVEQILALLAAGQTRDEVSEYYKQDWKTLYIYMNRKGYHWDKALETFVVKQEQEATAPSVVTLNTKAAQIIRMLDVKHPNIQHVAAKQGFSTVDELGAYMKAQGYRWNDELQNYEESVEAKELGVAPNQTKPSEGEMDEATFIRFLLQHQQELKALLCTDANQFTTYKFKGNKVNKTLTLASSAAALLEDYHKEYNLTQRAIIETALAEFFERHGYKEQLQAATT